MWRDIFTGGKLKGKRKNAVYKHPRLISGPHFTPHTLPSLSAPHIFHFFHNIPRYPISHYIFRHPTASLLPIPTEGVEERKALPGAATAVLAHGDDGGRLSKSQAPWILTTEGHLVAIIFGGGESLLVFRLSRLRTYSI